MDIHKLKLETDEILLSEHVTNLQKRYQEVIEKNKIGGLFLHRGVTRAKNTLDDYEWPLALTPYFLHWAPDASLDSGILITATDVCLFQIAHNNYWEGPAPRLVSGDKFYSKKTVAAFKNILFPKKTLFLGDDITLAKDLSLSLISPEILAELNHIRTHKTAYELKCLLAATEKALKAHKIIKEQFFNGEPVSEFSLQSDYLRSTQQTLFETPYQPIMAFGRNAAILHHVYYSKILNTNADESLLVDAGASVQYYASDITRTYCRGQSTAAGDFRGLIDALNKTQQGIGRKFIVGIEYEELHNEAHLDLAKILLDTGVLQNISADEAVASGLTRTFLPHGLGHSLGIQVHDVGLKTKAPSSNNPYLRNTSKVEARQVCTIEPGIYFIESLLKQVEGHAAVNWKTVDRLKPFGGIRIEDNIYADQSGPINITRSF